MAGKKYNLVILLLINCFFAAAQTDTVVKIPSKKSTAIRFIGLRSGNDLFTMAGLIRPLAKIGRPFFQYNHDRDYSASVLLEVGINRLRLPYNTKSSGYQVLLYGIDLFTPYHKNIIVFTSNDSYNTLDRPHAVYQYFGWSEKRVAANGKFRWSNTIKIGKIGGSAGERFQKMIHGTVASTPPRGWGAQIAGSGRFAAGIESRQEWQLAQHKALRLSGFTEEKVGAFITSMGTGLRLSNKSFAATDMNFITALKEGSRKKSKDGLMYAASFSVTYVQHNTALEGYGWFNSTEQIDSISPKGSHYFLRRNQLRRFVCLLNTTVSYTTRNVTFFYNWFSIGPETWLGKTGIISPLSHVELDLTNRWHHFAEFGAVWHIRPRK